MKILLDIDGVMVTTPLWKSVDVLEDEFSSFNPDAAANPCSILSSTNASVVLTTSHKSSFSIEEWKDIFRRRGIVVSSITCLLQNINYLSRKDEMLNWFKDNQEIEFVIIDDDKSLNDLPIDIKARLILTDSVIGLDKDKSVKAIVILNRNNIN